MKIYVVDMKVIVKYLIIFLITVSALIGSGDYVTTVGRNLVKRELPVYSVEREDKKIALTFDSDWDNKDVASILETLKNNNVKATFFSTGRWVEKYPESVKAIIEAGHELGNHSKTHPHIAKMSKEQIKDEIMNTHEKVKELCGYEMKSFRAPYGEYNNTVIRTTRELGYEVIQWDVDSLDWQNLSREQIINKVVNHKKLRSGSIILMHTGAKHTAEAVDELIKRLREKGYEFDMVSNIIYKDNFTINHEGRQVKTINN